METIIEEDNRETDTPSEWELDRRRNFHIFCVDAFLHGIELTILEPVEYFYYLNIMKTNTPVWHYSLSLASSITSSLISSLLASYVVKKFKKYRVIYVHLIIFSIIGYVVYSIPLSPYFVIFGKFISGFGRGTNTVSSIYLQKRLYSSTDIQTKIGILSNIVTCGSILGPLFTFLFMHINTNMGHFTLSYANLPGILLASIRLIHFIASFLLLTDLPRYDSPGRYLYIRGNFLKKFHLDGTVLDESKKPLLELEEMSRDRDIDQSRRHERISINQAFIEMCDIDLQLTFGAVFFSGIVYKIISSLIAVEAPIYLEWELQHITSLSFSNVLFGTIISGVTVWCMNYTNHVGNLLFGLLCGAISTILLSLLPLYSREKISATILFCVMSVLNVLAACLIGLSAKLVTARFLPERFTKLSDALRLCLTEAANILGALFVPVVHLDLGICGVVIVSITTIFVIVCTFNFRRYFRGDCCRCK